MSKILIAGDSFSSAELANGFGWPCLLAKKHQVTNISAPGIGEYKILQRLQSQDLTSYDHVIVSHTSPNRVHCESNPLYPPNHVYAGSDLIFADVENKSKTDPAAEFVYEYFVRIFDPDYYLFVHRACCEKIDQLLTTKKTIHLTHFDWTGFYEFDPMLNFYELWKENQGTYNHYTKLANQIIFQSLESQL